MSAIYNYEVVEHWGLGPLGRSMGGVVPGVAADSQGRVFVGRRHPPALLVYDRDGVYLDTWGADLLGNPHLLWVDGEDRVYAADTDDHTIRCFNPQGEVVHTWGTPGVPGAPDQPFNQPTKAMRGPSGDLYVADGYGPIPHPPPFGRGRVAPFLGIPGHRSGPVRPAPQFVGRPRRARLGR